ncbi:2719_t:CDS:2 [Cetraspora pellucida]|uniref:2719_t:CDS:1 n=1 Tax=Cetraspora pellucida TaxID=1433469 RepID=A0ACA9NJK9_9GLOM|nr:2719_t:CDS:2 [Cetraspora pellucida]
MKNQLLRQQIDSEHLIGLQKYENIKKILERIVGVIDESVENMNESLMQKAREKIRELKFPTEQQAFQEALQRGRSPTTRSPKITVTTTLEKMKIEEISLEDFQEKTQMRTNSAPPKFLEVPKELWKK